MPFFFLFFFWDQKSALTVLNFLAVELANEASGCFVDQKQLDRLSRMAEIEDLLGPRDLPVAPLYIKVQPSYLDLH